MIQKICGLNRKNIWYTCFLLPLSEQAEIVAYIKRETGRVDQLANQAKREMALMQEYRSALETETVTRGLPIVKAVWERRPQVGI